MLKLTSLLTFILLLCSCSDKAESDKASKESSGSEYVEGNSSLLWEISGNGLEQPSYLYGTIHIIPKEKFFTGENLEAKVAQSTVLIMEVQDITDLSAISSLRSELYLDSGSLKDYVRPELYNQFVEIAESKLGLSREAFEEQYGKMKPFMLYTIGAGLDNMPDTESYELYFMDLAYENDMDVAGLETIHDQLSFFNEVDYNDMFEYLIEMMSVEDSDENEIETLSDIYVSQNLDSIMHHMSGSGDMLMGKYREEFLDGRNKRWIPKIEEYIHKQPCFIAVGAAHLPGEFGVITLLREKGYTLKPVRID